MAGCKFSIKRGLITFQILYALCVATFVTYTAFVSFKMRLIYNTPELLLNQFGYALLALTVLGLYGAFKRNFWLTIMYAVTMLIMNIIQIAMIIYALTMYNRMMEYAYTVVTQSWHNYFDYHTVDMHTLQTSFECCGRYDFSDYKSKDRALPYTCCDQKFDICNEFNSYAPGCEIAVGTFWRQNVNILIAAAIGTTVVGLINFICACCMAKQIKKEKKEIVKPTTQAIS